MEPKQRWEKPRIVVLVKSQPEEAVLLACKGGTWGTVSKTARGNCMIKSGKNCTGPCNDLFPS